MELRDNNINEKIAYLRDTFLEAEKDYLDELKAETKYQKAIEKINKMDSKAICLEALRRIEDIENNNYKLLKLTDFLDVVTKKIDNEEDYKHIKNGNVMNIKSNNYILFTYENEDIALYEPFDNKIKPLIMF